MTSRVRRQGDEGTGARWGAGPLSRPGVPTSAAGQGSGPDAAGPRWRLPGGDLAVDRPVVMGVVNLTPDSFSDGGRWRDVADALEAAESMVAAGAGILDVGGESTRPGAVPVPVEEEIRRVVPFVRGATALGVPVSVDTRKAPVARAALDAGATIVNDVSGLAFDPAMAGVVAESGAGLVLMHMRGTPADMADRATYVDLHREVAEELAASIRRAERAGVPTDAVVVDPGIGFAKTAEHSLALLGDLSTVRALGRPVLVGPSRKSFIGATTGAPADERLPGTLAACVAAYLQGARIFRVHDVGPAVQALAVAAAVDDTRTSRPARSETGST